MSRMIQVGHHPDSFVQQPDPAYLCPIWWVNLLIAWMPKWKPRFYSDRIFLIYLRLRCNIRKGIHKRSEYLCILMSSNCAKYFPGEGSRWYLIFGRQSIYSTKLTPLKIQGCALTAPGRLRRLIFSSGRVDVLCHKSNVKQLTSHTSN